jgi:hypothetical protein
MFKNDISPLDGQQEKTRAYHTSVARQQFSARAYGASPPRPAFFFVWKIISRQEPDSGGTVRLHEFASHANSTQANLLSGFNIRLTSRRQ